jgi:hypothetical protein
LQLRFKHFLGKWFLRFHNLGIFKKKEPPRKGFYLPELCGSSAI